MSLEQIVAMIEPPACPIHQGRPDSWQERQKELGVSLPRCLLDFACLYGSGYFYGGTGTFWIYNPFDPSYKLEVQNASDTYIELRAEDPQYYPFSFYPERSGLYPIAYGGGGGVQFFIGMEESPEDYCVVYDDRSAGLLSYPGRTIFEFLFDFFSNRIEVNPFFANPIVFYPQAIINSD